MRFPHFLPLCAGFLAMLAMPCAMRGQQGGFHIFKGSEQVGTIAVSRTVNNHRVRYSMVSHSEFTIIWKQVVRTIVTADYEHGELTACHTAMRVNDAVRDSSSMVQRGGQAHCYVHPDERVARALPTSWTTARMYFEEPVDRRSIFVESVLQECSLQRTGEGRYTLTFPNKTRNHYLYQDGVLQEIHVVRPLFDLVFRRV
jgi:hypothetical protein